MAASSSIDGPPRMTISHCICFGGADCFCRAKTDVTVFLLH